MAKIRRKGSACAYEDRFEGGERVTGETTPMMEQYWRVKNEYKYCIVMFRLGDFYEMFHDDAIIASKALDLTLTARDCGGGQRAPMCGVPAHALDNYVARLIESGHKVAVCEQTEPVTQGNKKLIRREVSRVITPGTVIDANMLDPAGNNYIACVFDDPPNGAGFAFADVSTGYFAAYGLIAPKGGSISVLDELAAFSPAEIIVNERFTLDKEAASAFGSKPERRPDWHFEAGSARIKLCNRFGVLNLSGFGFDEADKADGLAIRAAGALFNYLEETQKGLLSQIAAIKKHTKSQFVAMDYAARSALEITPTSKRASAGSRKVSGAKGATLSETLDATETAFGARLLKDWLERPLVDPAAINARLSAVESAVKDAKARERMFGILRQMGDAERCAARIANKTATPRDLSGLQKTLSLLPALKAAAANFDDKMFQYFAAETDDLSDVAETLKQALSDDPPVLIRDGGAIRDGFSDELDSYRLAKRDGNAWLAELEAKEREETGIKGLKIRYNRVFGYYMEISKANKLPVPERFIKRQTLATAERYTTDRLQKIEEAILSADDKIISLEAGLFNDLRDGVSSHISRILETSAAAAAMDALCAFAEKAASNGYVKPIVDGGGVIDIRGGRHPVVECFCEEGFVPNDALLDTEGEYIAVVTGPNMAGKSTYMRQTALICLMAQAGSFVPADFAHIGVVDKIFTRVGASDDLSSGRSTFMVEMSEVANIVHNATRRSLLILDEIGRGTSTFDGLSLAWSVLEYISAEIGARTLFATHYQELTELEGKTKGVVNYRATAKEQGKTIVFLRKIERGAASFSYGVQVARLAGLPDKITDRADAILSALGERSGGKRGKASKTQTMPDDDAIVAAIRKKINAEW